jgi:hypothetical protein
MKKYLSVLVVIAIFTCLSCKDKIDKAKEADAIQAVIEGEINASFNGDYDTWTSFFIHEPYVVWMQAWKEGYACMKGWQEVSDSMKNYVKPERKGSMIYNGIYDYTIKSYGSGAFVSFKCKSTMISEGQSTQLESWETRLLENQGTNWKIAYLSTIYPSTYK